MVFYWSLSGRKSPQVSRILLSILADFNNAVVWTVSTRPLISKSFSPCINPSVTVPRAPITIGIIVTFMFHSFFNSLAKVEVLILLFAFFQFYSVASRNSKVHNLASSPSFFFFFFFFFLLLQGLVVWPRLGDPFYLKIPEECVRLILKERF